MSDQNDWRKEADTRYKEKSAGSRFKLKEGENTIRILPRKTAEGKFGGAPFYEYFQHKEVGPNQRFLTCGKNIRGQGKCWLCDEQIPKLKQSNKPAFLARAAGLEPAEQFVVQVAILDEEGKFRGPSLWSISSGSRRSLSTQLLGVLRSTKRDYVSLKKGYNLNIERTGTGFRDTRYGAIIPDTDPTEVPLAVVQKMKTLEELIPAYSAQEQQAAYFGRETEAAAEPEAYESVGEQEPDPTTEGVDPDADAYGEAYTEDDPLGEQQDPELEPDAISQEFEDVFNEDSEPEPPRRPAKPQPQPARQPTAPQQPARRPAVKPTPVPPKKVGRR